MKAADKISAYAKCLEELKAGNQEFAKAKESIEREIARLELPEVAYFMREFVRSFALETQTTLVFDPTGRELN